MQAAPFPLPAGHVFGVRPGDLQTHDGRDFSDARQLATWQRAYRARWDSSFSSDSGRFDGPTQRAVLAVQRVLGVPCTLLLGESEWRAVWEQTGGPIPSETPHVPPPELVVHGSTIDGPDWHPGRPFGVGETGAHVTRLRQILGLSPGRTYTDEVARRVRGLQRAHGLPVSGVCDVRFAQLIEIEKAPQP